MKTILAPRWAINLCKYAKLTDSPEARLLAIDSLRSQNCDYAVARDMVYGDCNFEVSDSFGYGPKWTHAVFNGDDTHNFKSGKLYPIKDINYQSFSCLSESGEWRFCLLRDCAHIEGNWTLVNMESE